MRRTVILATALFASTTAFADGRGAAIFSSRCAQCHVVGQGTPTNVDKAKKVDITLAARKHDPKWLEAFLAKPYAVNKDAACMAKLDEQSAARVIHFLRDRLRPVSPTAAAQSGSGGVSGPGAPGAIPPQSKMQSVPAPKPPKPQGMVHR